MKLSIIIPCYNIEDIVGDLYKKINKTLANIKYEVIFIDNGSTDKTLNKLNELYDKDLLHVKIISLARNFNNKYVICAGLKYAKGQYLGILNYNLSNFKYLNDMLETLESNLTFDGVFLEDEKKKKKSFFKLLTNYLTEEDDNDKLLCLIRENVKKAILDCDKYSLMKEDIFSYIGFNIKVIPYKDKQEELSLNEQKKIINLFNYFPFGLGILTFLIFLVYLFLLLFKFFNFKNYSIVLLFILFISTIHFFVQGFIYANCSLLKKSLEKGPNYIIKNIKGFEEKDNIL